MPPCHKPIVFVDTNILLNFYRFRNDSSLNLLRRIEPLQADIVTTYQVEMEFKKNRQAAILEALTTIKMPTVSVAPPAFLLGSEPVETIQKHLRDARSSVDHLKSTIREIFANPALHDPVFQTGQKLFANLSDLNLKRTSPERRKIKRAAWRRFVLGYPPRKAKDTSTGDAINWEWIVHCVQRTGRDVIIVSDDSDYGTHFDDASYINDWLLHELRERVSKNREVSLTRRLSVALDRLHIKVTAQERKEEEANLGQFSEVAMRLMNFWSGIVSLPPSQSELEKYQALFLHLAIHDKNWADALQLAWQFTPDNVPLKPS